MSTGQVHVSAGRNLMKTQQKQEVTELLTLGAPLPMRSVARRPACGGAKHTKALLPRPRNSLEPCRPADSSSCMNAKIRVRCGFQSSFLSTVAISSSACTWPLQSAVPLRSHAGHVRGWADGMLACCEDGCSRVEARAPCTLPAPNLSFALVARGASPAVDASVGNGGVEGALVLPLRWQFCRRPVNNGRTA